MTEPLSLFTAIILICVVWAVFVHGVYYLAVWYEENYGYLSYRKT